MGLKFTLPNEFYEGRGKVKIRPKWDWNGISFRCLFIFFVVLKSDQNGIEISDEEAWEMLNERLKSDQNGIEINMHVFDD